jgi:hypothetical protein
VRRIIILGGEVSATGKLRARAVFWIPRTPGATSWRSLPATSAVRDCTPEELQALREGTVVEAVVTSEWTASPNSLPQLRALLQEEYADKVQEIAREQSLANAIGGYSYDGDNWTQSSQPTIPEPPVPTGPAAPRAARTPETGQTNEELLRSIDSRLETLVTLLEIACT